MLPRFQSYVLVLLLAWLVSACGDKKRSSPQGNTSSESVTDSSAASSDGDEPKQAGGERTKGNPPTDAKPEKAVLKEKVVKGNEPKKEELPPESPEQIQAQCQGFLQKAWTKLGPAFEALKIENYANLESEYLTSYDARKFVKVCTFLGRIDRGCIAAAPNPIDALHFCRIDSSKTKGKTLNWPKVPGDSPLFQSTNRPAGEEAMLRQKLQGSWHNKGGYRLETWSIDAAGKTHVVKTKRDGTPEKASTNDVFTLSFPKSLEAMRTYESGSGQGLTFLMVDETSFYASGNMLYGAYDLNDGKNFVFKAQFDWGIVVDGKCTIVTKPGQVLDATCMRTDDTWTVTYQIPGKKRWRKKELEPTKVVYKVVNNHVLAPQLVRTGHFVRKP